MAHPGRLLSSQVVVIHWYLFKEHPLGIVKNTASEYRLVSPFIPLRHKFHDIRPKCRLCSLTFKIVLIKHIKIGFLKKPNPTKQHFIDK